MIEISSNQIAELIVVVHVLTKSLINLTTSVLTIPLFSKYFFWYHKTEKQSSPGRMLEHLELSSTKKLLMSGLIVHGKSKLNIRDVTHIMIQHHRELEKRTKTKGIKIKVLKNWEIFGGGGIFFPLETMFDRSLQRNVPQIE